MTLRNRGYLAEEIRHRELFGGQQVNVNLHKGTVGTLEREMKKYREPHIKKAYKEAIDAHKEAWKLFAALDPNKKSLTKDIRLAKKVAKLAHLLTRKLDLVR